MTGPDHRSGPIPISLVAHHVFCPRRGSPSVRGRLFHRGTETVPSRWRSCISPSVRGRLFIEATERTPTGSRCSIIAVRPWAALHRGIQARLLELTNAHHRRPSAGGSSRNPAHIQGHLDSMTTETAHRYLVAYDVTDDLRRTRAAKILESYGDRIQYSVFLIDIKPARLIRLKTAVTAQLRLDNDSLLICDLGPLIEGSSTHLQLLGATRPITGHGPLVV